ncbi:Putative beta-lactamase-inhibitor-like, PepSY-like [Flavobacterium segetis]|uniref:Putative beta-lactamase-inhibitor-like, PepSY-like n=1 Tax=Flavobacterium segetis TaxID=271157 RepID=A0A1M5HMI4_9FLAO|nr:PepSY-like domain-containing protein [Flavobacterium segetis]SHG17176.1 Putative beta-lactamase-inhibitor-like, PepSY-like [Flavobacterium segetis]
MKNLILVATMAISTVGFAQNKEKKEVPTVVNEAFQKEYPNTKVDWNIEKDSFEAEFKMNGKNASADYDKAGHKLAIEIAIKETEMPAKALAYIATTYPNKKIKETAKITDDKNVVTYEAEVKIDGKDMDLIFDVSGKFLKLLKG